MPIKNKIDQSELVNPRYWLARRGNALRALGNNEQNLGAARAKELRKF